MSERWLLAGLVLSSGILSCLGARLLIPLLRRRDVLDRPNERSLHAVPIPRGGGIALIGAVVIAWAALAWSGLLPAADAAVLAGTAFVAAVSWIDDLGGLSPLWRLLAQFAAVTFGMLALPPLPAALPAWLDPIVLAAAGLLWIWFINLFNFMDGIDGLAGSEAAMIALGLALFEGIGAAADPGAAALAACIAAAAVGFLVWNWSPARLFLGDVGSVGLGYLLGFLLLDLAWRGWWKMALILPLYFLADATITLMRRLLRGERVWQAHRQHFYQRAVQRGVRHAAIVKRVIAADAALIACGWAAEDGAGLVALGAAFAVVGLLLASLARWRPRAGG